MPRSRLTPIAALLAVGLAVSEARAQLGTFEATYGAWSNPLSFIWTLGFRRPLAGPLDYSLSLSHLSDRATATDRTQTGAEVSMGWGRDGSGPYAVAAVGLGMKHYDGNFDAAWS